MPYIYIIDTGVIVADTANVKSDIEAEWLGAVNPNLNLNSSTPQGTMIAGETIARTSVMRNNAEVANVINPDLSYGTFLDAVCNFLGIKRGIDRSTIATGIEITGNPSVVIQEGSRVQTSDGAIFLTVGQTIIDATGHALAVISSLDYGPIALPLGDLNIIDGTIGWGTAKVVAGTVVTDGALHLEDNQLKNQRNLRLAQQGTGSTEAIWAAILAVPNVTSCMVIENNTGVVGALNGITFTLPNAMWVCVAGTPVKSELAKALYEAHQSGCPWDYAAEGVPVDAPLGVPVLDPFSGQEYFVKWTTPVKYDLYVDVTVSTGTSSASPAQSVQSAILNYGAGKQPGEQGFVVGAQMSGFELAGAINYYVPGLYVKNVKVAVVLAGAAAPAPGAYATDIPMGPFTQVQLAVGNIKVTVV